MPEPAVPVSSPSVLDANALRIVLFGMPDAGKSSLLGALAQAAQVQEHLLNGHLIDSTHGLAELLHRLYEEAPRETLEEVVPYTVAFDPFPAGATGRAHLDAVLVDCDGRVANELLSRRRSLTAADHDGSLAAEILRADALVLVVDASAPPSQIDADFTEFGRFLRLLEQSRGRRSDVGGLPVFLVLTKCDLLAQPGDHVTAWMDRIEEHKRQVGQRFQEFLARHAAMGPLPFGSIDLHLWATAVKRPALVDSPARPREPYGVAELFRQCLEYAGGFRDRRSRSHWRLLWTVGGTAGVVTVMAAALLGLVLSRPQDRPTALAAQVDNYRLTEGSKTASERLRGPLQRRISELKEIVSAPDFLKLSTEDQEFVHARLRELEAYLEYRDQIQRVHPEDVRSEADLRRLENHLDNDLAPPSPYEREWAQTEAVLRRSQLSKDLHALRLGETKVETWYHEQATQAQDLRTFRRGKPSDAPSWEDWLRQVHDLAAKANPYPATAELPGSTTLTYGRILDWERVVEARKDWEESRLHLERLRDLVAALGLAGRAPDGGRQPLDIPTPFTLAQAHRHVQKLEKLYPQLLKEASAIEVPEGITREIQRVAQASYAHLLEPGREAALAHLRQASPDNQETLAAWRKLLPWLKNPDDLRDWRILADLLTPLLESKPGDPITALADLLARDRFTLDIKQLKLTIPFDRKLRPSGPLTVFLGSGGNPAAAALVFKLLEDEGRRNSQERVTVYTFVCESGSSLVYRPGDTLYANLPVRRDSDADWLLTWARSRSSLYQFERLVRPPRLHRKTEENTRGNLTEDVTITVDPESGLPRVPDLMPVVNLTGQ
jgi:hypothetical protein